VVQAQILSQKEAAKRLAHARHSREATLPVMFFGTLEIGWLQVSLSVLGPPCWAPRRAATIRACTCCMVSASSPSAEKGNNKPLQTLSCVLQPKDTLPWGKGCAAGHHKRLKPAILVTGIQQVCDSATLVSQFLRPDMTHEARFGSPSKTARDNTAF
jgi:hypothetical protein